MHYSRTGGATMRMPPNNFSSIGLARLFGADPDDEPKTSPHAAHSETSVIVGAVFGVVGLALLIALGGCAASWWRKTRFHPESEHQPHEIHGRDVGGNGRGRAVERFESQAQSASERFELPAESGSEGPIHELGPSMAWTTHIHAREDLAGF